MNMNIIDRSNYFRGSLLLIRKDRKISLPESELIKRIGKALGFEKRFCDDAIHDALENEHIPEIPPKFSTKELARKFIKDGLTLAAADNFIHPLEEKWLLSVVERNGLDVQWFHLQKKDTLERGHHSINLEVDNLTMALL